MSKEFEMIALTLPRVKEGPCWKEAVKSYSVVSYSYLAPHTQEELRRDAVIKRLTRDSDLYPGVQVRPVSDEAFVTEGLSRVVAVARDYKAFKMRGNDDDDWPANDNPYIVVVKQEKPGGTLVTATVGYYRKFVNGQ